MNLLRTTGSRNQGSILLLVLVITGLLSLMAMSHTASVRTQVADARERSLALRVEFAVGSGLEWVVAQIREDMDWEPDGTEVVSLGADTSFTVESKLRTVTALGVDAEFLIEGRIGNGVSRLHISIHIRPEPLVESSVACFGGQHEFEDCTIRGKLIIADQLDVVYDSVYDPLDPTRVQYELGGAEMLGPIGFVNPDVDELERFTTTEYIGPPTVETQRTEVLYTPRWNLDEYLIPGPDRVIINHSGNGDLNLSNQTMSETLVVVLDEGARLTLKNGRYWGGIVMYAPPNHDIRSGPYNYLLIKHPPCDIGQGSDGVHPELGILAPGAEFSIQCAHLQELFGFFIFHSAVNADKFYGVGQVIFLDRVEGLFCDFTFDPSVSANLPPGISYGGTDRNVTINWIRESFEP